MDVLERASRYIAKMPTAVSGSGGHTATFAVASVLVHGFALTDDEALALLRDWNGTHCQPAWSDRELQHKVRSARQAGSDKPSGHLVAEGRPGSVDRRPSRPAGNWEPPPKVEFDEEQLVRFAGELRGRISRVWLAERSHFDPAAINADAFLEALYDRSTERVLVFTAQYSQGDAVWPLDSIPRKGREGIWFLAAPVDGDFRPGDSPESMTRRSGSCVVSWRWMVIESDDAPADLWLAALVRLPLRIAALYTSGDRSVHALVRLDAVSQTDWMEQRRKMQAGLVLLGADLGAMSSVRLTRLPGCIRYGKKKKDGTYVRFDPPRTQRLLYLNPAAPMCPLVDLPRVRDVAATWGRLAELGVSDSDETGGAALRYALRHYGEDLPELAAAAAALFSSGN